MPLPSSTQASKGTDISQIITSEADDYEMGWVLWVVGGEKMGPSLGEMGHQLAWSRGSWDLWNRNMRHEDEMRRHQGI